MNKVTPSKSSEAGMDVPFSTVEEAMEMIMESSGTTKVFGEPIKNNGTMIIPVAEVISGMGMGGGFGKGKMAGSRKPGGNEEGGGGGGGGRVRSRPIAVVVASGENVWVEPVVDKTRVAIAGIVAGCIAGFLIMRIFGR